MRKLINEELGRLSVEEFRAAEKIPVVVVLDNVRSLNHIGSVFRTADAFGIAAIYLCGITATPPNKDIHKTALGATESVLWNYFENSLDAINELRSKGFRIMSVEQVEQSISLETFKVDAATSYALVFGHEVHGVDQAIVSASDACLEIPQFGTKHSLNVSVSAGVVLWEFAKQLKFRAI